MTENDTRSRSVGVKCTVMILMIIIVTVMAVTFLCTHYTSGLSEFPKFIHRQVDHYSNDKNSYSEKSTAPVVNLDESRTFAGRGQPLIAPTESVSDSAVEQRVRKLRSDKHAWTGKPRRSLVGQGRLTAKTIPYATDRFREAVADRAMELRDINSRSNRQNYQHTKSDEWVDHHASYDLTTSLDHNDAFKYADADLTDGIALRPHYSFDDGAYYGPITGSSTMHYRPSLRPAPIYPVLSPQTKISISKKEKFDWHTIGLLILVKAGLIKLKLFSILKILFLLLFKLKLFLIAIFMKIILLLKSSKLFKTLFLPLLILPLFLIFLALILPIIMSLMYLIPGQSLNMMSPAPTSTLSSLLSNLIPNLPGIPARPSSTKSFMSDQYSNILKNILASRSGTHRFIGSSLYNKRDIEPLAKIDTALNIFQKLLDSETCVKRIACQMAAVGKAGIMDHWINRLLNSILSMFIDIEKGKTHVKTYDDVNNGIIRNFSTPASWTTWCMEPDDCNRTIISNTTESDLL